MTNNGRLKSSAELRDELVRIDAVIETTKQDETDAHAEIRSLARAAIAPNGNDALAKIKSAEGRLGAAKMTHKRLLDARAEVEAELGDAIAQERQTEREKDAAAAEEFAQTLPHIFLEVDHHFAEFRRSFTAAVAAINEGRARGWNVPSQELLQSKLTRALRTSLSLGELRMLDMPPLPSPERTSFSSLGESYARAVRGGAKHSALPPKPTPQPMPQQTAAKSEDFKMPQRGDVGMRFRDDPKEFEIRVPTAR
jgi:hypothetical protein